ncbi:MAG: hypothetical protein O7A65_04295 [Proteobacteria bacterium]|nr:hypothetical protein [Pseudomonadota bacterium]
MNTFNRGLDLADRRRIEGNDKALDKEVERNMDKAQKIAAPDGGIYKKALRMAEQKYNWWQF